MGIYVNPNNKNFQKVLNAEIYVDKSGLIETTNKRLNTENCNICVSRPRRFGKSVNLGMLSAYYSRGCDSRELFDSLFIAKNEDYLKHLNKYNVIYIQHYVNLRSSVYVYFLYQLTYYHLFLFYARTLKFFCPCSEL